MIRNENFNNKISIKKYQLYSIFGLIILLFIMIPIVNNTIYKPIKHIPISVDVINKLKTQETIKLSLNDSTIIMVIDSMESFKSFMTYFKLGINHLKISIKDSKPIISDSLFIPTIYPGEIIIEIDNKCDDLGSFWRIDPYAYMFTHFYKSFMGVDSIKRVKFVIFQPNHEY